MLTPKEAYQYDTTFRRVVDSMRAYLHEYEITPAELRQAAMLAATMHVYQHVKPLYISKFGGMDYRTIYFDEAKNFPEMFGGLQSAVQDKQAGTKPVLNCICSANGKFALTHTTTCQHYNWEYFRLPKSEHKFNIIRNIRAYDEYRVCCFCGLSDVYVAFSGATCKAS